MCGIAGIVSLGERPVFESELRAMCEVMAHRGPDGAGYYVAPSVGLGMRRLSIIDIEGGQQPIGNEDGTIWVVLNGEIYNFASLRRELEARGHVFSTDTDTEVIVHLYEERGVQCVDALRGMFAFAVWDSHRREAMVARDRLGIKPLYYAIAGGRLVFASEMKAILELPEVEPELNWEAVARVFAFLTSPAKDSVIRGIHKLEPGRYFMVGPGRDLRIDRYWQVAFAPDETHDDRYFVDRLGELLHETVGLHMVSDVPLGAFLSGGVDSSAVVAAMARVAEGRVKTFSIGFADQAYDERRYAARVARHLGTDHQALVVEPADIATIEDIVWHLDEPFGDSSAVPTYFVSKMAAEHVTVALSGDGGDEVFAGYDRYRIEERERGHVIPAPVRGVLGLAARAMPPAMRGRGFVRHFSLDGWTRYVDAMTLCHRDEQGRLFHRDVRAALAGCDPWHDEVVRLGAGVADDWLSALQAFDLEGYLPLDVLTKVDRMSMAHSLEVRPPLLDHRMVEFAATIPARLRLSGGRGKHVFKESLRGVLPDDIIDRRKQGFAAPFASWFTGSLSEFAHDLLLSRRSIERGFLDSRSVARALGRRQPSNSFVWTLIVFEQWCRLMLDRPSSTRRAELRTRPRAYQEVTRHGWDAAKHRIHVEAPAPAR